MALAGDYVRCCWAFGPALPAREIGGLILKKQKAVKEAETARSDAVTAKRVATAVNTELEELRERAKGGASAASAEAEKARAEATAAHAVAAAAKLEATEAIAEKLSMENALFAHAETNIRNDMALKQAHGEAVRAKQSALDDRCLRAISTNIIATPNTYITELAESERDQALAKAAGASDDATRAAVEARRARDASEAERAMGAARQRDIESAGEAVERFKKEKKKHVFN
ncbi:hypothetical protein T492DRAFT_846275 [Pavlovales sp. CCMP2436]|nr:hypothetical protein T492DRAFT_846275 [Pavlovales sp. CCMP2436]